jgi:hypothetical protein
LRDGGSVTEPCADAGPVWPTTIVKAATMTVTEASTSRLARRETLIDLLQQVMTCAALDES